MPLLTSRRMFLGGLGAGLLVAPSIVRAESLMHLRGAPLTAPTEYRDYILRTGGCKYEVWRRRLVPDRAQIFCLTDPVSVAAAFASPFSYLCVPNWYNGRASESILEGASTLRRWREADEVVINHPRWKDDRNVAAPVSRWRE